ncbi:Cytochrome b5 like Heme Steroid binding domain [Trypanosoma vivax]|uniref:Cytochrome b5 heme-binding domain-containing protein n=1 Tax=Trypanosoma vivax (strain Y486) TaxID=1055687 RepID=G0TVD6_TRYVY|nr:hypothetical protein TRVL_04420 [Trypanosoma vivax]KAH8617683.1 Cytochrome b5 like Heme Steroid binding domain [Trypanosoma vivax]CCC47902.1 conserved hypothetical protein [Trypanosoma vivax Y486]
MQFNFSEGLSFGCFISSFIAGFVVLMCATLFLRARQRLVGTARTLSFVPRGYTLEELSEYDGVRKPQAFVAVRGVIYNCSLDFYGANAPYNAFAGRDSSRHLGKMKVGREETNADWTTLCVEHLAVLDDWEARFRGKYEVVGWIIPSDDFCERSKKFDP